MRTFCISTISAIILRVTYGYQAKESNDPFIEIAEEALESLAIAGNPGTFLVDLIPWRTCVMHSPISDEYY
jgi:hypothetical protein